MILMLRKLRPMGSGRKSAPQRRYLTVNRQTPQNIC